jgi:predicted porin
MKNTLLATTFTFCFVSASAAYAETSVTLYGIVDAGVGFQQTKISQGDSWAKTRDIGLINGVRNGNRWGMKGSEDLGNGTSAIFQLESGFDIGNGKSLQGNRLFGRYAYIGLTGSDWGTLTLGRQVNLAGDIIGPANPFSVGYMQAGVLFGAFGASTYARMDNSVKYVSPDLAGFKVGIGYSGENSKTTSSNGIAEFETRDTSNWITAGVSYNNGPFSVAASYDRFRTDYRDLDGDLKGTTHMWNLFGAYDFEAIKLYLGYGQVRGSVANDIIVGNGAGSTGLNSAFNEYTKITNQNSSVYGLNYAETNGYRQQAWLVGLTAPVGDMGKIMFSYQGSATKNTGDAFDGAKGKLGIFSLGYEHKLSKRTTIYAIASYGSGKLKFDTAESVRLKSTLVGVGLNHRF